MSVWVQSLLTHYALGVVDIYEKKKKAQTRLIEPANDFV